MPETGRVAPRSIDCQPAAGGTSARGRFAGVYLKLIELMFGHRTRIRVCAESAEASFATDDDYSRCWFYPRYAWGGVHERPVTSRVLGALRGARCFADVGAN